VQKSIAGLLSQVTEDGSVMNVSAGTAVMHTVEGYKETSKKRVQGWGQGLALVFFADLLRTKQRKYD
jgi:unsaturated rhamnogalacturonyl hydrolase